MSQRYLKRNISFSQQILETIFSRISHSNPFFFLEEIVWKPPSFPDNPKRLIKTVSRRRQSTFSAPHTGNPKGRLLTKRTGKRLESSIYLEMNQMHPHHTLTLSAEYTERCRFYFREYINQCTVHENIEEI